MIDAAKRLGPEVRLVCDSKAQIGESPVPISQGRIVWVDPLAPRILCHVDDRMEETRLEQAIWSLATTACGDLVGTTEAGFCLIDAATGNIERAPDAHLKPGCRFNDMAIDPRGGLWAGSMHRGVLAGQGLVHYSASLNLAPVPVANGLGVPNGMVFSADGKTLYVIDTLARTLLAYPADCVAGKLGEPAIVTDFMGVPGKPDGMTIGSDGSLWVAMWGGGCVVEIASDGALLRRVDVPAPHVSSLCFCNLGTLYVTTSRMRLSSIELERHPASGGLIEVRLS